MKTWKKAISLTLALALCLGLMTVSASAATLTRVVEPGKYSDIGYFSDGLAAVQDESGKYGLINRTGREVVPCKYADMGVYFSDGLAAVKDENGKWGYIDQTGEEVIPCRYDRAWDFSEGVAAVRTGDSETGKYSFIDKTGKEVISLDSKYDDVASFCEGLARVAVLEESGYKYGYIDRTGKEAVPCKYGSAFAFSDGLVMVGVGSYSDMKYGIIDKTGKEIVPCKYADMGMYFSDGLAAVKDENGKWGFVDLTGKEVIPCKYDEAEPHSEGLAVVGVGEYPDTKYGFIDKTGREVVPCKYDEVYSFSESLAAVKDENGKWGFVDQTGKEVISCKYDEVHSFSGGLAAVKDENGKWGFVDQTGGEVIPCKYNYVYSDDDSFSDGLARVDDESGEFCYIDKTGNKYLTGEITTMMGDGLSDGMLIVNVLGADGEIIGQSVYAIGAEAIPTNDKLTVNGVLAEPTVYKINGGNYFKLRDLAVLLNGTSCQFDVGYDAATNSVTADSGKGYTKLDGDMAGPATANQTATLSNDKIIVNGQAAQVEVYKIDGGNYFKLRDLGTALGFTVGWDAATSTASITTNG